MNGKVSIFENTYLHVLTSVCLCSYVCLLCSRLLVQVVPVVMSSQIFFWCLSLSAIFRFLIHVLFEYMETELSFYFFSWMEGEME